VKSGRDRSRVESSDSVPTYLTNSLIAVESCDVNTASVQIS